MSRATERSAASIFGASGPLAPVIVTLSTGVSASPRGEAPTSSARRIAPVVAVYLLTAVAVEAYRQLQTNLQFLDVDAPPRVLMVSSAVPAEGKLSMDTLLTVSENALRSLRIWLRFSYGLSLYPFVRRSTMSTYSSIRSVCIPARCARSSYLLRCRCRGAAGEDRDGGADEPVVRQDGNAHGDAVRSP